jgi:hypothetical protein
MKGYMYMSYCDVLVQLGRYDNFDSYPPFCWLINTKWPSHYVAQPPLSSWMRSLKNRFNIRSEDSIWRQASVLHYISLSPLRPYASLSKLTSSQDVPTAQQSNTHTNALSGGKGTRN